MASQITIKSTGLATSPNQINPPEGSLKLASNVIIRREDVIESRRGFKLYGTSMFGLAKQLFTYKGRLLRHFDSTLQYDTQELNTINQSIFNSFSGSFDEVDPGLRIKSIEANGNFYFTTSEGIKKISASSADQFTTASNYITPAGGVKAINGSARLNIDLGSLNGFLPQDSAVAYRLVWGIRDANNNLILGAPSERIVVYNPLMGFLVPDFNRLLSALDSLYDISVTNSAVINDGDYLQTYGSSSSTTPTDLQTKIIGLANKLDNDIIYASDTPVNEPLTIVSAIISSGVATITFNTTPGPYIIEGSNINLAGFAAASGSINGGQVVTTVVGNDITFNTTASGAVTITGSTITSYEYSYAISHINYLNSIVDLNTQTINSPATNNQLVILQAAIDAIITRLQQEPDPVISTANQSAYISDLDITTLANVILTINIPQDAVNGYFLQIYRSDITQATGTTLLSDLVPNDEMRQVYEAFPTPAELAALQMTVEDVVVDAFRGANLYTNPATGEGILQSNDIPPVAKDINRFKQVLFYANTKTRHRTNLNLLGVQNFKAGSLVSISAGGPPATVTTSADHELTVDQIVYFNGTGLANFDKKLLRVLSTPTSTTFTVGVSGGIGSTTGYYSNSMISISTDSSYNEYYFIRGKNELRTLTAASKAGTTASGYFTLYSANNAQGYYVWFDTTGTDTDPAPANLIGIKVDISSASIITDADVAYKTRAVLSTFSDTFTTVIPSSPSNQIIVENYNEGIATDSALFSIGAWTVVTNTQGTGENAADNEILLSSAISPAQAVDETSRSLLNVVNTKPTENIYIYYLSGLSDVPGKMLFEARDISASQFFILANNFDTGDSFDPPITPSPTTTLTNTAGTPTIVTVASHGLVSGDNVILGFSNSTAPINGKYLVTFLSTNTYSVPVNTTIAGNTGSMIKATNAVSSQNEEKKNRIYYSKFQQPEAVPLINYFDVGSEEKAILRIFPLRDSLFVFKEDGLFRVSGETAPFVLGLFDSSCIMLAPDSLGVSNNILYAWTTQGIHTVSEAGIDIISRNIDVDILKLASTNYPNFKTITWGTGYDSDNSYTVYTNKATNDTVATIAYRFNNLTNTWTTVDKTNVCGIINSADDRMYMGAGDVNFIEQERKTFTREDYADREIGVVLGSNSFFNDGGRIKLSSVTNIKAGDVLYQNQLLTVYKFNNLLTQLDSDPGVGRVPITSITLGSTPTITIKNLDFLPAAVNTGTNVITLPSNNFSTNEKVRFESTGTLPSPLIANTDYFVQNPTLTTFQLSLSPSGLIIDLTTTGTGIHKAYKFHNLSSLTDILTLTNTNSDPVIDGDYTVNSIINGYQFTINLINPVTTAGTSGTYQFSYEASLPLAGGGNPQTAISLLTQRLDTDPGTHLNTYAQQVAFQTGNVALVGAANPAILSMKSFNFLPADVNIGTDVITVNSHGFIANDIVTFASTSALPGGINSSPFKYYIINPTMNTFQLALTASGLPIDITSIGSGIHSIRLSHNLVNGRYIALTGTNSTPTIDNNYQITVINPYQFTVPKAVQVSGNAGLYVTQVNNFIDIQAVYNATAVQLNLDDGVVLNTYQSITNNTPIESLITSVNTFSNEITLAPSLDFLIGDMTVFRAIETSFLTTPITMGDPLGYKHLSEFTMMFDNKAFTKAVVSFATDLLPELTPVEFEGDGNGIFGHKMNFGDNFFGGGSHAAPFRTYIPRNAQRCRYLVVKFVHRVAREQYAVYGMTITGNISISTRAYRR